MQDVTRRTLVAGGAVLPWATARANAGDAPMPSGSKILVACFTRSGNIQVIDGTVHRALGADLFEIRPTQPYPEGYEQTVAQADQETKRSYEPQLAATVPNFAFCETVFLGWPIWGRPSGRSSPMAATAPVTPTRTKVAEWRGVLQIECAQIYKVQQTWGARSAPSAGICRAATKHVAGPWAAAKSRSISLCDFCSIETGLIEPLRP